MSAGFFTLLVLGALTLHADNKIVRLHDGKAPGSETWTHTEKTQRVAWGDGQIVYNVVDPTLTVFQAPSDNANAAVIVCPGGAFFMLAIDHEGVQVARALNARGITAFVLKYRLVKCETDNPMGEVMSRGNLDPIVDPIVKLALADGLAAIRHVRSHASDYGVAAKKPAELHIFAKGGHGFGMNKQNLPTDRWLDQFVDWLGVQGFTR